MIDNIVQGSKTNYVQFDNDIIIDTISGLPVGASQKGLTRILNCAESTLRDWLKDPVRSFSLLDLEIYTPIGLRSARVIPFSAFKDAFKRFNPDLLEAASDYGIAAFTLNLAGYSPNTSPSPLPRDERKDQMEAYLSAAKLLQLEMAILDLPGQKAINDKLVASVSTQLALPQGTDWISAMQYLDLIDYQMERKDLWNFTRACTNIYRMVYQQEPPKFKNSFVYPSKLFPYFETWIDGLVSA
jgi:hypothetical protein